jgi:8-oxo-dGTP diphosphatase
MKDSYRRDLSALIASIKSYDALEERHIADSLAWIKSGAELFRHNRDDNPKQHLVSYFVLFDYSASMMLLVDHIKASLWLPSGGHVEKNEHPKTTVERECREELGSNALFYFDHPVFLTKTFINNTFYQHYDVSLWYLLKGDHRCFYNFDKKESSSIRWFHIDDLPYSKSDPHLERFIKKLKVILPSVELHELDADHRLYNLDYR